MLPLVKIKKPNSKAVVVQLSAPLLARGNMRECNPCVWTRDQCAYTRVKRSAIITPNLTAVRLRINDLTVRPAAVRTCVAILSV